MLGISIRRDAGSDSGLQGQSAATGDDVVKFEANQRGEAPRGRRSRLAALLTATALLVAAPVDLTRPGNVNVSNAAERILKVNGGGEQLTITKGKSETMRTATPFGDLVVGDPDVADVVPLTDQSFYVLGKAVGQTNVSVYDGKKQLVGIVDIEVGHDGDRLQAEIAKRVPGSSIRASTVNGKILLSGLVPDAPSVERAVTIAKQFGPDVINSLSVGTPQQVMLEVRFVELQRNAGRDLGVSFSARSSKVNADGSTSAGGAGGLLSGSGDLVSGGTPYAAGIIQMVSNGLSVDLLIKALEERGVARRLAEPNLVALSGDTASFLAGGELPIPISRKDGELAVEYKQFGVGLAFTPTVLDKGQINLKIVPEVSELDYSKTVSYGGITLPSLVVRRANTTIEMRDGQSFAIAGLLQSTESNNVEQLPWLGSVPVLGTLFRSTSFQKKETELVIIVTPRLVRPVAPGQVMRTPTDVVKPPTDVEAFVMGKIETREDLTRYIEHGGKRPLLTGHIIADPKTIEIKGDKANVATR